uniref:MAT1-2-1 mating type protein n=1 Tax=Stagonosporopsis chrysanthemi TaxID=1200837 RepID=A0A097F700_9PLEO|nr:MAT1-2-1 mating type protein [Stagonosporopsis chrysanthemi]
MITKACLSSIPTQELALTTTVDSDTMAQFYNALDACVCGWLRGDTVVLLQGNIQELFGDVCMSYFEQSLTQQVGQAITFTFSPNSYGGQTIVQMPENKTVSTYLQSPASPPTAATEAPSRSRKASPGIKKAPRPMNCWIIFRDAMHKVLKAENPHLTVQEISIRCSEIWHGLSPAEKKPWRDAATLRKDEHSRAHPDYKYSPRKPGEKKKRQSRKAKQAPAFAANPGLFDISPVSDTTTVAHDELQTFTPVDLPLPAVSEAPIDFGANFTADVAQLMDETTLLGLGMTTQLGLDMTAELPDEFLTGEFLQDTEPLRHDKLEAEFGADFEGTMPFDLFGEESRLDGTQRSGYMYSTLS